MAPSLPSFIALKKYVEGWVDDSKLKYLGCSTDGGHLEYSFPVLDPAAKFAVEPAKSGGGLVHIRSCKNNKYWVRSSPKELLIMAAASEPKEDLSAWDCTLFKASISGGFGENETCKVTFEQCQLGSAVSLSYNPSPGEEFRLCLSNHPQVFEKCNISRVVDYDSLVILPKRVVFQGDNERYLLASPSYYADVTLWSFMPEPPKIGTHCYLKFASTDIGSEWVGEEVFPTDDGYYRFKNIKNDKFWRRSPNWIWADSTDTSSDNLDTLFEAVKVDVKNNIIALRNLGNNNFCNRLTIDGMESCLNAGTSSLIKEAKLKVVEPIITRSIKVLDYRFDDAKISGRTPMTMGTSCARNPSNKYNKMTIQFTYTKTTTTTWNNSVSLKLGVKANLSAKIPFVAKGTFELSAEVTEEFQFGVSKTETNTVEASYVVDVPPSSMVTVNMVATKATCSIPFSYTQTDQFTSGKPISLTLEDGVFTFDDAIRVDFVPTKAERLPREQSE